VLVRAFEDVLAADGADAVGVVLVNVLLHGSDTLIVGLAPNVCPARAVDHP